MAQQDFSDLLSAAPSVAKPTAAPQEKAPAANQFADLLAIAPAAQAQGSGLFDALLMQESGGKQTDKSGAPVTSKKGAIGIAQVMPGTAPEAARLAGLPYDDMRYRTDAEYNKALGRAYFDKQLTDFGDEAKALAAYNAGPGAVAKAIKAAQDSGNPDGWLNFLPAETRSYVPAILSKSGAQATRVQPQQADHSNTYKPPVQPRGMFGAVNDTVIELANAAAGGVKAASDFISPGNPVSRFIDGQIIKPGEESQSDQVKAEKARLQDEMQSATGAADEVSAFLGYMARNPVLAAAQAAGSFVLPGGAAKGASSIAKALGIGTAGSIAAGTGAASVASGALSGGDAAGTAYELVMKTPDDIIAKSPQAQELMAGGRMGIGQAKEALATAAAREASVVPAAVGAALGPLGAERILAGAGRTGGRAAYAAKTGAVDAITGGAEEGITQFEGQAAAAKINPEIDPTKGVAGAATAGAVLEGAMGASVGALAPKVVPPALQPVADKAAEPNSTLSKAAMAGASAAAAMPQPEQAAPQVDPITARVVEIENEVRQNGVLQTLRDIGQNGLTEKEFLEALAIARNPTMDQKSPLIRQRALESLEEALGWAREGRMPGLTNERGMATTEQPVQPGTGLATQQGGQLSTQGPADFFDPNTVDVDATRVDNMIGGPRAIEGPRARLGMDGNVSTQPQNFDTTEQRVDAANTTEQPAAQPAPEMSAPAAQDIPARPVQQTVEQATEGMPRVQIPEATAEDARTGNAPAARRKRRAQVEQLVGAGFETVERRDNQFVLKNAKTKQEVILDGAVEAQLARAAIARMVADKANTAAASPLNDRLEPTPAQIAAHNYKKSDVIELNGTKIVIENPAGSTRRGVGADGKAWEAKMAHHYGEFLGTEGADGDRLDVFIGPRPDSAKVYVVDQKNQDGSFDEHKIVMGATTEDQARQVYLSNYEKGWTGLGAITEMSLDDFKAWAKSERAKQPLMYGKQDKVITVNDGGNPVQILPLDASDVGENSAARTGKGKVVSKKDAELIRSIAAIFGVDAQFFRPVTPGFSADGFFNGGNTLYINERTTITPLAIFGHEFTHLIKERMPQAYDSIAKVVSANVKDPKGYRADYFGQSYADENGDAPLTEAELEELVSDLNGNLMTSSKFWREVFDQVAKDHGKEAKGIIARLSAFLGNAIDMVVSGLKGGRFNAGQFVNNTKDIRAAFKDGLAQYLAASDISKTAMQAEILRSEQQAKKAGDIKRTAPRATDGLTVEGYHFSKEARPTLTTGAFGTGLQGSDRDEIMAAKDGRLKQRLSFYVNKGAVKQDEVTWSGLEDWMDLQEGKITKEQIADYLERGGVQVQETVLGQGRIKSFEEWVADQGYGPGAIDDFGSTLRHSYEAFKESEGQKSGGTKYGKYTLPGGENYREVLLTLPSAADEGSDAIKRLRSATNETEYNAARDEIDRARSAQYKSSHWDQPNVIAHIRANDRTDADGNKVLFVEEVQSDWGQDGKKKGFGTKEKLVKPGERGSLLSTMIGKASEKMVAAGVDRPTAETAVSKLPHDAVARLVGMVPEYQSLLDREAEDRKNGQSIPAAPFVTKTDGWLNLALKRIVAMAVDGGYDKVAFVNGEQSADRYDLSKSISEVNYEPAGNGLYEISAKDMSGKTVLDEDEVTLTRVEELVGKEIAQKIEAGEGEKHEDGYRDWRKLSGLDLKVGGEGMKTFYDYIVPQAVKKLTSKMDGKLEAVGLMNESEGWKITPPDQNIYGKWMVKSSDYNSRGLTFDTEAEAKAALMEKAGALEQPGFTITPKMQEQVSGQGMPLFSRARNPQEDTQEFKDWFGDSKVVDANGKPLVVYHGTGSDFTEFDPERVGSNYARRGGSKGFFFTNRPVPAGVYAEQAAGAYFGNEQSPDFGDGTANIMPAYLSLQKPYIRKAAASPDRWFDGNHEKLFAAAEKSGADGIIVRGGTGFEVRSIYVAFRPEQIKSATGNNGAFSSSDPDIRKSTGRTATGADWDSQSASKFDDMVYKLQDKQVDLKRVVEAVKTASGSLADDLNVYLQEELYHGRAAKRTEDFVNMELTPLIERMKADGLEISDVEEFLHARHAPEANKVIAQRNPGVQDLQDGGSGMKTSDALDYMNRLDPAKKAKLEAAAAQVDAIIKKTREMYIDYELESKSTVDAWDNMFSHYIPLQREDKDAGPGLGQGFSVKGKETKGRTGSTRKVVDILANVAIQREKAIVRGEKNRVSQALVGLAKDNPNEGFWTVDEVPTERVFNPKTGLVEDRVDPLYKSRNNAVIAKIADASGQVKEHAVLFNEEDPRALRMAESLKNLDANQIEGLLGISAKISRYFASINTQLNPVFGVVNLVRDVQGALLNLSSTPLKGDEGKIAKYTASALKGVYFDARAARKGSQPSSPWAKLWDEFQEVGGQTGYRDLFATSADRAEAIQKALDPDTWMKSPLGKVFTANGLLKVPMSEAMKRAGWLFDWISDYNLAMENGVRLAAYKAGLERGMSKEQAASAAKNLTVNFNRKGQVSQQAGAMYAFFNASVQGTARIFQTVFEMEPGKPKTIRLNPFGKKVVMGGIALGSIQAMALAAAGFNDDDPPEFARERGLIIPIGDKKYLTIPMPLGFHVLPSIGRISTEFALSGFKDPHKRALSMASLFADTFNPIGNAGLSMQTLAPTALDPFVALTENKDYTGKPIARESSNKAIPGHALGKDTATTLAKLTSEGVNALSGGNKYTSGVFSPTPDQIDYLIGQLTGGVGRELSKVEQSVLSTARGEDLPTYKIPLVGRFVGDSKSQASEGGSFYANTERLNRLETEIKGLQKDGKTAEAAELRRSSSEAYLISMANQAERQIQKLRAEKRELVKADAPREQVKAVEERITASMARLNRAVESLKEKQPN